MTQCKRCLSSMFPLLQVGCEFCTNYDQVWMHDCVRSGSDCVRPGSHARVELSKQRTLPSNVAVLKPKR
jgi:hypothetical protein